VTGPLLPLRDYQEDGMRKLVAALARVQRVAGVLPTGGGKTVLFGHMSAHYVAAQKARGSNRKVLVLAHRDELVTQAARKIKSIAPHLPVGIVKAERDEVWAPVVVASVQTLRHGRRLAALRDVGLIIVDECHHATAQSYRTILEHYGCFNPERGTKAVGVTATLARTDGAALREVWEEAIVIETMAGLIRRGFLLDPVGKRVEVPDLDLREVRRSRGDYQDGDLGRAMVARLAPEVVAKAYLEHAPEDYGVMFWPTVESAQIAATAMNDMGIRTESVWGSQSLDDRRTILRHADEGKVQVLSNCMVLTEGFDWPRARVGVIARPTRFTGLYQQMAGRVLRPYPGQEKALLLDVVGASYQHDLATLVDLAEKPVREPRDGESLMEAMERTATELDDLDEVQLYRGETVSTDFDPLGGMRRTWLTSREGTRFLPCTDRYLFLAPSTDPVAPPGTWDVCWAAADRPIGGKLGGFLERGLDLGYAASWAEVHVQELIDAGKATSYADKAASWRKKRPSSQQLRLAARYGIEVADDTRSGALSEQIDTAKASPIVDHFVNQILKR
jgi:superfamily II DNA or RNA helicase